MIEMEPTLGYESCVLPSKVRKTRNPFIISPTIVFQLAIWKIDQEEKTNNSKWEIVVFFSSNSLFSSCQSFCRGCDCLQVQCGLLLLSLRKPRLWFPPQSPPGTPISPVVSGLAEKRFRWELSTRLYQLRVKDFTVEQHCKGSVSGSTSIVAQYFCWQYAFLDNIHLYRVFQVKKMNCCCFFFCFF